MYFSDFLKDLIQIYFSKKYEITKRQVGSTRTITVETIKLNNKQKGF